MAGSGKTTALAAVRECLEEAGFEVVGTSTSGQAARTLGREAGIEPSRTIASLCWRLERGTLVLTDRHALVLDEAGMSDDPDFLRVLCHAGQARSKVLVVGDHLQLPAVGPGGGFEALVVRHRAVTHVLADNVRQLDLGERAALEQLRSGKVAEAVDWNVANGRIVVVPNREAALDAVVEGWAADVADEARTAMYAWKRANVAELNRRGREAWERRGRLSGPELVAPGGTPYRAGDRIVTLAPGEWGKSVTSECGSVVAVDVARGELAAVMDDDGRIVRFAGKEIDAEHLAHGYAVTVHRAQGATVRFAHTLEDGGGRELAYVKLSRAEERSMVYAVADDLEQAAEDLVRGWSVSRRIRWAIDTGVPSREPEPAGRPQPAPEVLAGLRHARLVAERDALAGAVPPDWREQTGRNLDALGALGRQREDLSRGTGRYTDTAVGAAARELAEARRQRERADALAASPSSSRRQRRSFSRDAEGWRGRELEAQRRWQRLATPELARLEREEACVRDADESLRERVRNRRGWLEQHPEITPRLARLEKEIEAVERVIDPERMVFEPNVPQPWVKTLERGRAIEPSGLELGL